MNTTNNHKYKLISLFILIFILLLVFLYNYATYYDLLGGLIKRVIRKEETIQPVAYWNFNNSSNYLKNVSGADHNLILPTDSQITYDEDGKYVTYYGNKLSRLEVSNDSNLNPSIFGGFAVEFLFRVVDKREFAKDRVHFVWNEHFSHPSYLIGASGKYPDTNTPALVWRVEYNNRVNSNRRYKELVIHLTGTDRADLDYYFDDQWHHMVSMYTYNNETKKMELKVWIDGQSPEGFSKIFDFSEITDLQNLPNQDYNNNVSWETNIQVGNFWGSDSNPPRAVVDMDQVAIYNQVLSERLIYQHYIESIIEKHNYSFLYKRLEVPAAKKMTDVRCIYYHPGFNNSDVGTNSNFNLGHCGESTTPLYQLKQFSDPRYKYNNSLNKLDYFVGNPYLVNFDDYHPARSTNNNITKLREDTLFELAKNWNYYIQVADLALLNTDAKVKSNLFSTYHFLNLADRHPDYPISVHNNWSGNISNNNLEEDDTNYYYLYCGEDICTKTYCKDKCISPATNLDIIETDGAEINQKLGYINEILDGKIDLLVENGEVEPIIYEKDVLEADPNVIEDKARYPSSSDNEEEDWLIYQAKKKKEIIDVFFSQFRENDVFSNDAILSHYNISGLSGKWSPFFFKWEAFYNFFEYSTPYLYPLNLYGWRLGGEVGSRIGWLFIPSARSYEFNIESAQKPYWPFVAAGWHTDRTENLRPGPWLGLLKMLVVTGAESFYPGYFHCHTHSDCDLEIDTTDKWIWQLAIPSYAQAIASKVEDDFFKDGKFGTLLEGDVKNKYSYNNIGYEFYANDWRYLAVVRKSEDNSKLLIGGVKMAGKSPDIAMIENVDGISSLSFPVRTQGSVYLYNKNDQTLVQLDTWHKNRHPWYWPKKSHLFEAEVPDEMDDGCWYKWQIKTDHNGNDYSNFVSYLEPKEESDSCSGMENRLPQATYRLNVKRDLVGNYVTLIRARRISSGETNLGIDIDNLAINSEFSIGGKTSVEIVDPKIDVGEAIENVRIRFKGLVEDMNFGVGTGPEINSDTELDIDEELFEDRDGFTYYLDPSAVLVNLKEGWHEATLTGAPGIQIDQVIFVRVPEIRPRVVVMDYRIKNSDDTPADCVDDPDDPSNCRKLHHRITLKNISIGAVNINGISNLLKNIYIKKVEGGTFEPELSVDFQNTDSTFYQINPGREITIDLVDEGDAKKTNYKIYVNDIVENDGGCDATEDELKNWKCTSNSIYYNTYEVKIDMTDNVGGDSFCYRFDYYSNDVTGGIEPIDCSRI